MYRRCSHSVVVYVSTFLAFKPITGYIHFSTNSSYSHFIHNGLHSLSAMFPCQFGGVCVCVCVCIYIYIYVRDTGSIHGSGRSPGEGHGNPLQCSCLENPMDQGAWQATVHRVAKSQTQLKLSIALDLQKICRYITEFPHMLYPPSPNSNILYNHSTFVKTRKLSVVKSY